MWTVCHSCCLVIFGVAHFTLIVLLHYLIMCSVAACAGGSAGDGRDGWQHILELECGTQWSSTRPRTILRRTVPFKEPSPQPQPGAWGLPPPWRHARRRRGIPGDSWRHRPDWVWRQRADGFHAVRAKGRVGQQRRTKSAQPLRRSYHQPARYQLFAYLCNLWCLMSIMLCIP